MNTVTQTMKYRQALINYEIVDSEIDEVEPPARKEKELER